MSSSKTPLAQEKGEKRPRETSSPSASEILVGYFIVYNNKLRQTNQEDNQHEITEQMHPIFLSGAFTPSILGRQDSMPPYPTTPSTLMTTFTPISSLAMELGQSSKKRDKHFCCLP